MEVIGNGGHKGDEDRDGGYHRFAFKQVEGDQRAHGGGGARHARDQGREQIDRHIFIDAHAVPHIAQGVGLALFVLGILQFRIVFPAVLHQRDHNADADEHGHNGHGREGKAGARHRVHKEVEREADHDGGDHGDKALDRNDVGAFVGIVRQRHDQAVHR